MDVLYLGKRRPYGNAIQVTDSLTKWGGISLETKVYYYFCNACGTETAAYDVHGACPYCRSGRQDFHLVAESNDSLAAQKMELAKARWLSKSTDTQPTKRGGLSRWLKG